MELEKIKYAALAVLTIVVIISGCGGGGSSSSQEQTSQSNTGNSPPPNNPNNSSKLSNSIEINPLLDLGLDKGESVCFRIKSYNNVSESDFSGAICKKIKDAKAFTLTWNTVPGNVVGYYVYYGTKKKNVDKFLRDVLAS